MSRVTSRIPHALRPHSHDGADQVDTAMDAAGLRALWVSAAVLATTALVQAAREIWRRLMDAVDPGVLDRAEQTLLATPGVLGIGRVRLRWIGHQMRAECEVIVDAEATVIEAHQVAVRAEHDLRHALPRLTAALVHADPQGRDGADYHPGLAAHG